MTDDEREEAARTALAAQYGSPLSDEEWCIAKANLLAYFRLLRDWELRKKAGGKEPS